LRAVRAESTLGLANVATDRNMGRVIPFARPGDGRQAVNSLAEQVRADLLSEVEDAVRWAAWMEKAQRGDRAAYHALLVAITPYLRAIARRYLRQEQDAEDMVQEILIVVHDIRHTYEPGRPLKPWLATIATRRCIDQLRQRMRQGLHESADDELLERLADESPAATPEARLEREQDSQVVQRAVQALPARQREAVELLRIRELSLKEAAAASEQSIGSLKVACHRAMKALQRAMTGQEQDHD
jgi:RNA polymerase sigma-70 factor (ECF subfamily)